MAEGKIRIACHKGEKIPEGWIIDNQGYSSTNPVDLYKQGALLPFGNHKGYALALMVEVIGGILSGANTPIFPDYGQMHNGVFMLAIDPNFFRPEKEYGRATDFLFSAIKRTLPAQGMKGALIPGEPERKCWEKRNKSGIPIDDRTWGNIETSAYNVGIKLKP